MTKLTLPIQDGKRYVRRDGKVITTKSYGEDLLAVDDEIFINTLVWKETGRSNHTWDDSPYDLVADVNQCHPHAENMRLYYEDALTTPEPWKLWQVREDNTESWSPLKAFSPAWFPEFQYRRAPKIFTLGVGAIEFSLTKDELLALQAEIKVLLES